MMKKKKQTKPENLSSLYNTLKKKGTPTNEKMIYLSDGMYINSKGDIIDLGR